MTHVRSDLEIVEGWTAPVDFQMLADGSPYSIGGTDILEGVMFDRNLSAIDMVSDVSVLSSTDGTVRLSPDPTDFTAALSPFLFRLKITDQTGKVAYWPSGRAFVFEVRTP